MCFLSFPKKLTTERNGQSPCAELRLSGLVRCPTNFTNVLKLKPVPEYRLGVRRDMYWNQRYASATQKGYPHHTLFHTNESYHTELLIAQDCLQITIWVNSAHHS